MDDDSDQEFERFLQEDDDSTSMSASFREAPISSKQVAPSATATQKKLSSASAVTAAAAALLASSRSTSKAMSSSNNKKKGKEKTGKKTATKKHRASTLSDSEEEPPPSYTERSGSRSGLAADPYAFDLDSSFHLKASDDEDSDDDVNSKKKKITKKESTKKTKEPLAKKEVGVNCSTTKSVLSLEDRVAQILKRTGSSVFPPSKAIDERETKHSDDDDNHDHDAKTRDSDEFASDGSGKAAARNPLTRQAAPATAERKAAVPDNSSDDGSDFDAKRLSLSDSLGMESADFEVGLYSKRKLERSRLSLSSLNSEKFAVNVDALEESELTNPRYPTQNDTFTAKRYDQDDGEEPDANDDYGDEGFELDQTTVGDINLAQMSSYSESYLGKSEGFDTSKSDTEAPFISQFDKMKELFLVDSSFDPVSADTKHEEEETAAENDARAGSSEYTADQDGFGYEDEDFEPDEVASTREKAETSMEQNDGDQIELKVGPSGANAANLPNDEAQQVDTPAVAAATELPNWYLRPLTDAEAMDSIASNTVQLVPESNGISAIIADTALASEQRVADKGEQRNQRASPLPPPTYQQPEKITFVEAESAPMSPPPPPPPDDEDEPEDDDFHTFTLDRDEPSQSRNVNTASPATIMTTAAKPLDRLQQSAAVDRFRHFQSHVSVLRIIEAPQQPSHKKVAPVAHQKRRKPRGVSPAEVPIAPPIDLEEESKEMEDFLRQSRRLKHEQHQMHSMRSSTTRESELTLRLQHAHRQILQLKCHIQEGEGGEERFEADDGSPTNSAPASPSSSKDDDIKDVPMRSTEIRSSRRRDGLSKGGDAPQKISAAELAKIQKDIQTQETLIQAYQRENEQLMRQLKKIQQSVQYDAYMENEQLKKQLKELREQFEHRDAADGGVDITNMGQYRLAVEARLHAEAHALSLQEELAAARARHQQRENELKLSLDRVKKAKVEIECRYEGIDLAKVADESKSVRKLQNELVLAKKESEHALISLQKKIDWYVENQRLLDAQDDEIKRLKEETSRLTSETQTLRSQRPSNGSGTPSKSPLSKHGGQFQPHHRSATDIRRISELETRLLELEEAMRKRYPDSLVNLILASRKAEEESTIKAMDDAYQQQLRAKEEDIEQLQEANEKKLKSFRQQQERLVLLFQKRIREQEKQLQQRHSHSKYGTKRQTSVTAVQDRDGDDEVKRVRKFYTEKIKELERKWETKYRSLKKQQFGSAPVGSAAGDNSSRREMQDLSYADSTIIITNLQRQLREKEAMLKKLMTQLHALEEESEVSRHDHQLRAAPAPSAETVSDASDRVDKLSRKNEELSGYVRSLEAQLKASEEARSHLVETLSTLQTFTMEHEALQVTPDRNINRSPKISEEQFKVRITDELSTKFQLEIDALSQIHERELLRARETILTLEKQACEHTDALKKATSQLNGHAKEIERLQQRVSMAEQEKCELHELADHVPWLENEVARLQEQLMIPRTPSMLQYRSLEMKIETLMQKHLLREAELKVLLSKATHSSELEKLQLERVHQNAIAAKNVEIRHFKKQLDDILYELELLRQPQAP